MSHLYQPTDQINVALLQFNAGPDVALNKKTIETLAYSSSCQSADVLILPECSAYRHTGGEDPIYLCELTEDIIPWFQSLATQLSKWIIVGSFFRRGSEEKGFNTCVCIDPKGNVGQTYDKIHLFDVTIGDTIITESRSFLSGNEPKMTTINNFILGLSICFDLRFPELYRHYSVSGAHVLLAPSSFTASTGKRHWHALCRARAIENQCYVLAPNQYGTGANGVDTYGHSLIVDPNGQIVAEGEENTDCIISATLSMSYLLGIRKKFPFLEAKTSFL